MSTPSDDAPTTVLQQQTVEQPAVTTAPATRRTRVWQRKLPPRIGRARTSTVVIGCLYVLLFALNSSLPQVDTRTVSVSYNGRTVQVPVSALPSDARPTSGNAPTAPGTSQAPASTSSGPSSTQGPRTSAGTGTTAPTGTSTTTSGQRSAPATTTRAPAPTSEAPTTEAPTSEAPAPTSAPEPVAPTS